MKLTGGGDQLKGSGRPVTASAEANEEECKKNIKKKNGIFTL